MSMVVNPFLFNTVGGGGGCGLLTGAPTANLQFDLVGECLVGADGSSPTSWADSSPAVNDLISIVGMTKETNVINGLSVAKVIGAGQGTFTSAITVASNFTFLAVVKPTDLSGQRTLICGPTGSLQVRFNANKINVLKCATADMGSSSTNLSTGTFYTIGVTYDGSTLKFYLNGVADGVVSVSQTFSADVTKMFVNVANSGEVGHFELAEPLLWTSALTGATHMVNGGGGVTDALRTNYAHY